MRGCWIPPEAAICTQVVVAKLAIVATIPLDLLAMSAVGLKTSGKELKRMLELSGARHRLEGAEKLDFLIWLADQVKGSIEEGRRMKLSCEDLTSFLQKEEMLAAGHNMDPKGVVCGLLALRRREQDRLNYNSDGFQEDDARFESTLCLMDAGQVASCFGQVAVYDKAPSMTREFSSPEQVRPSSQTPPAAYSNDVPDNFTNNVSTTAATQSQVPRQSSSGSYIPPPPGFRPPPTFPSSPAAAAAPAPQPDAAARSKSCAVM